MIAPKERIKYKYLDIATTLRSKLTYDDIIESVLRKIDVFYLISAHASVYARGGGVTCLRVYALRWRCLSRWACVARY